MKLDVPLESYGKPPCMTDLHWRPRGHPECSMVSGETGRRRSMRPLSVARSTDLLESFLQTKIRQKVSILSSSGLAARRLSATSAISPIAVVVGLSLGRRRRRIECASQRMPPSWYHCQRRKFAFVRNLMGVTVAKSRPHGTTSRILVLCRG